MTLQPQATVLLAYPDWLTQKDLGFPRYRSIISICASL